MVDGGNLTLNTKTLTFENIKDVDETKSSGYGFSTTIGKGSSTNTNNPNQQNNYFPDGSTTISLNNQGHKKEQDTRATVGNGTINITDPNNSINSDISTLNRDINNSQVITKDTITNALDVKTTLDNRLFTKEGRNQIGEEVAHLPGNLLVTGINAGTGLKDVATSVGDINSNDPKNDNYFKVLANKTKLRSDSIFNIKEMLKAGKDVKYYDDINDNKDGYRDRSTREIFINLARTKDLSESDKNQFLTNLILHETEHGDSRYDNLSKEVEESLVRNYEKKASDMINFYHNQGNYENSNLSKITSWSYDNSSAGDIYGLNSDYLNSLYQNSTKDVTNNFVATNNIKVRNTDENKIEGYQEDVHHYLTKSLAKHAGFSEQDSEMIAKADQGTDEDKNTEPFASRWARENYHFTTIERREEMLKAAIKSNDLNLFGQYLHAFQDSYSHQNSEVPETWYRSILNLVSPQETNTSYPASTGHLVDGEWPDKTYNRPQLADDMAKATYDEMQNFLTQTNRKTTGEWSTISKSIRRFNRTKNDNNDDKGKQLFQ